MSRLDSVTSAKVLAFPGPQVARISQAEIDRGIARAHTLRAQALREGLKHVADFLGRGSSLRSLRLAGGMPGRRHSCC